jgi:hypothetical protein
MLWYPLEAVVVGAAVNVVGADDPSHSVGRHVQDIMRWPSEKQLSSSWS